MAPPSFKGESQPLLVESWMREIEKIFRAIRCAEEDKVSLATYMLQERADVWWASLLHTRFEDGAIEVAWDEFVTLFRAKLVPAVGLYTVFILLCEEMANKVLGVCLAVGLYTVFPLG
ncbi:hypothetical protein Taro_000039 [Colocasia esculenta]|uniref:Retrotransposon gag domain-containing protein n=1 Tax=Colocasia esculenta TaxID=4460 RepID=A0A843TDQ2_COLES|nr:hypothetical protein [Colocasia esculenta]